MPVKGTVEVDVTKAVETHIQAAIANALSGDPSKLVEAVVRSALEVKKDTYSRQTVFQAMVNDMIRSAAQEEFKRWIDEHKAVIRSAVAKRLDAAGGTFLEAVADKLVSGLAESFSVSCYLKVEED
ncbi:MAG TPA: hypothetical protein VFH61_08425 [Thermoleophilia bacterium]|nr:hypothetical protein [Thermoleophilia bacterium]